MYIKYAKMKELEEKRLKDVYTAMNLQMNDLTTKDVITAIHYILEDFQDMRDPYHD